MAIKTVDKENFKDNILEAKQPIVVEFWAPWCGYCKRLSPVLDVIAKKHEGIFDIYKINVDDNPELQESYNVMTIPSLFIFKNGEPIGPLIAPKSKLDIDNWLKENSLI